jgi:hypothetical protein
MIRFTNAWFWELQMNSKKSLYPFWEGNQLANNLWDFRYQSSQNLNTGVTRKNVDVAVVGWWTAMESASQWNPRKGHNSALLAKACFPRKLSTATHSPRSTTSAHHGHTLTHHQ